MSNSLKPTPSPVFDREANALDGPVKSFWFNHYPAAYASRLQDRIKLAAKLAAKAAGIQRSRALDAVAQALRFPAWHHLAMHLSAADSFGSEPLPTGWLDALSPAAFLLNQLDDDAALSKGMVHTLERFGEALAMLTDAPKQRILDNVSAALCNGTSWQEVCDRTPLKATAPFYRFTTSELEAEGILVGSFVTSSACDHLTNELDDRWELYERLDQKGKRATKRWLECVLAAQPGFLEAGRALAWMQRESDEVKALETVTRFVRLADALIPKGFKGRIEWAYLGNRVYHRLLGLQMDLLHEHRQSAAATRICRRMLRLNPEDNGGARFILPFLLLEQGQTAAARRALKALAKESWPTEAVARAFVAFAESDVAAFRRELAMALFTLPALRIFLTNDPNSLPTGEEGYRNIQPDMERFGMYAWPSYLLTPGLRAACAAFLANEDVIAAEERLRVYWNAYRKSRRESAMGIRTGSVDEWQRLVQEYAHQISGISSAG